MNRDFASSLIQLNNTFYREHSASFSDTRQAPWPGWVRTMDIALACGNMRFENFAAGGALAAKGVDGANPSADASCPFEFYGVDSCQDLAIDARGHALRIPNLHFQELDVLDALMKLNPAETPDVLFDAPLADISVCFGFMHHVPSCEYRVRVPRRLRVTIPRSLKPATTSLAGKTTATPTAIAITLTISRSPTWCAASVRSTRAARSPCASLSVSMPTVAAASSTAM